MDTIKALQEERRKLSTELKLAEQTMLAKLRDSRPTKDAQFSSVEDREVYMRGMCAMEISKYEHLKRLWEVTAEELQVAIMVQEKQHSV